MPGLTVTEKTFWKDRIAARIAKRIEAIQAAHPALFERVKRQAPCPTPSPRCRGGRMGRAKPTCWITVRLACGETKE